MKVKRGMEFQIRHTLILLALILIVPFTFPSSEAQVGVGVSPGIIHFNNVLRGGYSESFVTASVSKEESVSVTAKARGQIAGWLTFEGGPHYQVSRLNPARIKVIVVPPSDVANGIYTGTIRFTTSPLGTVTQGAGTAIQVSIDVLVTVEITDVQSLNCKADSFRIRRAEENQPVSFSSNILNTGNVRFSPGADVVVWNQKQDEIVKTFINLASGKEILPTVRETTFFNFQSMGLSPSQYWAEITVRPCEDSRLLTFDILEEGALSFDGILKTIITKVWADVGEVVPITAVFQNIGETSVKARFEGTVQLDGRIVEVLESDETSVSVGEEANLVTFFTPDQPGRYIVKGKVFYGGKETFEATGIINVVGVKINYPVIIVYSLIVALLIFIIYKLHKRRSRLRAY